MTLKKKYDTLVAKKYLPKIRKVAITEKRWKIKQENQGLFVISTPQKQGRNCGWTGEQRHYNMIFYFFFHHEEMMRKIVETLSLGTT